MFKLLKSILGIVLVLVGLRICVSGVKVLFDTSRYSATALVEIEPQTAGADTNQPTDSQAKLHFIQKQFGIILSEEVLGKVAESINLDAGRTHRLGVETNPQTANTPVKLKNQLALMPIHHTTLLRIRCRGEQPQEAATLANAVAKAYFEHCARALDEARSKNFSLSGIVRVQIIEPAEAPESPDPFGLIATIMLVGGSILIIGGVVLLKFTRRPPILQ